jgi:hypothetical protein
MHFVSSLWSLVSGLGSRASKRIQSRGDVGNAIPEGLLERAAELFADSFNPNKNFAVRRFRIRNGRHDGKWKTGKINDWTKRIGSVSS